MSEYDVQESFINYIYNLITTDTDVQTAMGGTVRLYLVMAEPDAEFPYLVHNLDMSRPVGETIFPLKQSLYYLDIWSYSSDMAEILLIRDSLIELIDERCTGNDELGALRIWSERDGLILDNNLGQGVWHYEMVFNVRLYRILETANIINRG